MREVTRMIRACSRPGEPTRQKVKRSGYADVPCPSDNEIECERRLRVIIGRVALECARLGLLPAARERPRQQRGD
jgi:hypothetical protein